MIPPPLRPTASFEVQNSIVAETDIFVPETESDEVHLPAGVRCLMRKSPVLAGVLEGAGLVAGVDAADDESVLQVRGDTSLGWHAYTCQDSLDGC